MNWKQGHNFFSPEMKFLVRTKFFFLSSKYLYQCIHSFICKLEYSKLFFYYQTCLNILCLHDTVLLKTFCIDEKTFLYTHNERCDWCKQFMRRSIPMSDVIFSSMSHCGVSFFFSTSSRQNSFTLSVTLVSRIYRGEKKNS